MSLIWTLFLIKDLYLTGIWQGLKLRKDIWTIDTILGSIANTVEKAYVIA